MKQVLVTETSHRYGLVRVVLALQKGGSCAAPAGYGPAGNAHGGGLFDSMGMGSDLFSNSEFEFNRESRGGILFGVEPQFRGSTSAA